MGLVEYVNSNFGRRSGSCGATALCGHPLAAQAETSGYGEWAERATLIRAVRCGLCWPSDCWRSGGGGAGEASNHDADCERIDETGFGSEEKERTGWSH